jgi:hypothetical protein
MHLIDGAAEQRIQLELDLKLERGDTFPYGIEIYTVGSVQDGHDEFDGIVFAVLARDRPSGPE